MVLHCPLSLAWGHRTGDRPATRLFSVLILLLLFTVLQGATGRLAGRVFPWCLSFIMPRWGQVTCDSPYRWQYDSYLTNILKVLVSLLWHASSYSFPILTILCPCRLVDFVLSLPPNMGLLASGWSSHPTSYGSLGRWGSSRQKITTNSTREPVHFIHNYIWLLSYERCIYL